MTTQIQEHPWQSNADSPQSPQDVHFQQYGIFLSWGFGQEEQNE